MVTLCQVALALALTFGAQAPARDATVSTGSYASAPTVDVLQAAHGHSSASPHCRVHVWGVEAVDPNLDDFVGAECLAVNAACPVPAALPPASFSQWLKPAWVPPLAQILQAAVSSGQMRGPPTL